MKHLLLIAPPGSGKTIYAKSITATHEVVHHAQKWGVDIFAISRLTRLPDPSPGQIPFRAPHHTVSLKGLRGELSNGFVVRPGELSLAHGGVLFIDEVTEFSRETIETLLETVERKQVRLVNKESQVIVPADFLLIVASNLCLCGYEGTNRPCSCSDESKKRFQEKLKPFREFCEVIDLKARF
jgi:magnesium chelatase family protein